MNLKYTNIILLISLILIPNAKSAETLFLYKGTFNRSINIEELDKFKDKKITSQKSFGVEITPADASGAAPAFVTVTMEQNNIA